jgi:hypothetical protein
MIFFNLARRGYSYVAHKLAFLRAMLCICILKKYADNPQQASKEKHLSAIRKFIHWRRRCGLDIREFVKMAYRWGYNVPRIMRILTKS